MSKVDYRKGDYRVVAERLLPAARELVAWCDPQPGQRVVDVAAGSGNVSWLCRARGADVVAVDLVLEQLLLGRADGAGVHWTVGDAHALPLRDGSADLVLSTFGLIFADRPDIAVGEAARVCRPGGLIGLTTWDGSGLQRAQYDVMAEFLPDLRGGHDALAVWGTPEAIESRLAPVALDVEVRPGRLVRTYASIAAWWDDRVAHAPPVLTAKSMLSAEQFDELGRRMRDAVRPFGRDVDGGWELADEYLLVRGSVR
ncbi:MAG TPA: methyltransferase domain-containing protein [Mycobacteriales bacterium]|nr:methyltransferase domain-containing protein [Mycobacteriales bacterium]